MFSVYFIPVIVIGHARRSKLVSSPVDVLAYVTHFYLIWQLTLNQ